MSSAAKLRKYGRGAAVVASAALVMTSFGPAAFAAWDDAPQIAGTDTVSQAATGVGIVDADKAKAQTQGATLVQAGQTDQALSDVRLVLPNSFKKGDIVDLRLFDRSATETANGRGNSGPSTKMEFSADPSTDVSGPKASDTVVSITNADNEATPQNTEGGGGKAWAAGANTSGVAAQAPSVTPAFDISRVASTGSAYKDTIRLTVNTDPSTGDPNAKWVVTVKGLKVDLGAQVTPGELRLVPFAYNTENNKLVAAPSVFSGNFEAQEVAGVATPRAISIYTAPGYVSPVTFEAGSPNIVAGAGAQSIGDLSIKETNGASLLSGSYTVNIVGATLTNADASSIKAAIENGGTGEGVTVTGVATDKKSFTFTLAGADATKVSTLKFSGLMLTAADPGKLTFRLSGGSVDQYLANPAGTSSAIVNNGTVIYPADEAFLGQAASPITVAPQAAATASGLNGAGAPTTGDYTVVADGSAFRLNDASGDTVARSFDGQNWTAQAPYDAAPTFNRALTVGEIVEIRGTGAATTQSATAAPAATVSTVIPTADLLDGTYTLRRQADGTWNLLNPDGTVRATAANATNPAFTIGSQTLTVTPGVDRATLTVAEGGDGTVAAADISEAVPAPTTAPSGATFSPTATAGAATNLTLPPNGTYTVQSYQAAGGTTAYRLLDGTTPVATSTDGVVFTFVAPFSGSMDLNGSGVNTTPLVEEGASVAFDTAATATTRSTTPTATMAATTPLSNGSYTVNRAGNGAYTITNAGGDVVATGNTAGTSFTLAAPGNGVIVFDQAPVSGTTFTVNSATVTEHINQRDIVAPLDAVTQLGTVSAGTSAIGGTNRFGTAARIASEFVKSTGRPTADTAIIVNGIQAPDALSSSFLSQREGAPILLTAPGQLPAETVEALRDLGVRKVYIVGGRTAVGSAVFDALKNQNAYMWDDAAKAIKPRGDKLEVVQLGGDNRYQTNWRVNTYAAAQTAGNAPVGKIAVGYGQALKTTAMVARSSTSNDFVDALSASVLSAGRAGGLEQKRGAGVANTVAVTTGAFQLLNPADAAKMPVGTYRLVVSATATNDIVDASGTVVGTWTPNNLNFTNPAVGTIPLAGTAANGNVFSVSVNQDADAIYGYDTTAAKTNALPVILTQPSMLVPEAASQMRALHIEHTLLIGSDAALAKKVNDDIAAVGPTSYRIEGKDRWETAANVNRFAMAPEAVTATGQVPGLGFDGSHVYSDNARTNRVGGEMVTYLANGMKFPDALVAGPWVSRTRNSMVMTLQNDLPEPTAVFISEKAAQLDRAAGLGQGAAVSSGVIVEANKIASSK